MTDKEREMRELFLPIAVLEHHQMVDPVLSTYDISDRLGLLWPEIRRDAESNSFTLDPSSILNVNQRIARSLGIEDGCVFRNEDRWVDFVRELGTIGGIDEDPSHMCSWIFSALYWGHLVRCKPATAWFFTNAIRIQHKLPEYRLTLDKLGPFLRSLSGSGPPIYDGQTFYPEDYSP
jgi:hypothetical protein